jgi:UDP-GlcNAc:undecaprenyl-phosphate GlcNAc-1-phosphate transferase
MGDAGALFLGVLIATLTISLQPDTDSFWKSLATPILLLAVPILDTTTVVVSRIKRGVSPLQGGHDHLSHRLMNKGISRKHSVMLLWAPTLIFTIILTLNS